LRHIVAPRRCARRRSVGVAAWLPSHLTGLSIGACGARLRGLAAAGLLGAVKDCDACVFFGAAGPTAGLDPVLHGQCCSSKMMFDMLETNNHSMRTWVLLA